MKWVESAIEDLRKYNGLKASVRNISERIETLEFEFVSVGGSQTDIEPVSGDGGNHQEEFVINNIAERERLKLLLTFNRRILAITERGLASLTDDEKLVLEYFFINRSKNHIEILKEKLGAEQSEVYRLKERALRKFTVHMYGIEEC